MKRWAILLVLMLLAVCLSGCGGNNSNTAEPWAEPTKEPVDSKYSRAQTLLSENQYAEAAALFDELGGYEDAVRLAMYCKAAAAGESGDCEAAIASFTVLDDFRDSKLMVVYYRGRQYEYAAETADKGMNLVEAARTYETLGMFRDSRERMEACLEGAYAEAGELAQKGEYYSAALIYNEILDYKDSQQLLIKAGTDLLYDSGDWAAAHEIYMTLDEPYRTHAADYQQAYDAAAQARSDGRYDEAIEGFTKLGNYNGSREEIPPTWYAKGIALRESQEWDGAREAFQAAGDYSDAKDQISETTYQEATALEASGDQEGAYNLFISLGSYRDSFERANKPFYDLGMELREAGDWDGAVEAFKHAGTYNDAPEQIPATRYMEGEARRAAQDWDSARKAFENAGDYSDAKDQISETTYQEAVALQQAGRYDEAITAFERLDGYSDSATQITETKYLQGKAFAENGEYAKAATILICIKGYKDVDSLLTNDEKLAAAARDATYAVGSYVTFGHYPQTEAGDDSTPIEWLVLARDGQKALLISRYGLDAQPYHTEYVDVTWENCTLRTWLNDTFLNKAFTPEEQTGILLTEVDNSDSQGYSGWNSSGGNNTQDRIFLLSFAEANKYLGVTYSDSNNTKSRTTPTAYAIKRGAYTSNSNKTADRTAAGWWWLRSPGYYQGRAAGVSPDGSLHYGSVIYGNGSVRPALWINLESDIF